MALARNVVDLTGPSAVDIYSEFRAGRNQLEIHAQDIHATSSTEIYATEALPRWRRVHGELWAADVALPVAEQLGVIVQTTELITELSLTAWSTASRRLDGGHLSIKLHRTQLGDQGFVDRAVARLAELGLDPNEIVLEIPDRLGPRGCRAAVEAIGPLIDNGARVLLDEYRGSASPTRPTSDWFPAGSVVRLDTALTSACDGAFGRELLERTTEHLQIEGYAVAAESIERPTQLVSLIRCGVTWAQGLLFSPPALLN